MPATEMEQGRIAIVKRLGSFIFLISASILGCFPLNSYAVDQSVLDAQQRRIDVIERVSKTVVAIFGASGGGGDRVC